MFTLSFLFRFMVFSMTSIRHHPTIFQFLFGELALFYFLFVTFQHRLSWKRPASFQELEAVAEVMKHWNFPESIWGALETCHRGLHYEFSRSPGFLTCKVFVTAHTAPFTNKHGALPLPLDESSAKAYRVCEMFCFFNRHTEGFSAECKVGRCSSHSPG